MHAHLKGEQGIRLSELEVLDKKVDSIGDIVIYLADYCEKNQISLNYAVKITWDKVKQRDWQKNKTTGVEPSHS